MSTARLSLLALILSACGGSAPPAEPSKSPTATSAAKDQTTYVCPMHPEVTSTDPSARCTECGMDLVKKDDKSKSAHDGHGH